MRIVLDANILISALLGSGSAISIVTDPRHYFYAPHIIVTEVSRYAEHISKKKTKTVGEIMEAFAALREFIQIVKENDYAAQIGRAASAIGWRDATDIAYVACALAIAADCILTQDRDFVSQSLVPIKTIAEWLQENRKA